MPPEREYQNITAPTDYLAYNTHSNYGHCPVQECYLMAGLSASLQSDIVIDFAKFLVQNAVCESLW